MNNIIFFLINNENSMKRTYPNFISKTHYISQKCFFLTKERNFTQLICSSIIFQQISFMYSQNSIFFLKTNTYNCFVN
mgnify:CR=1 FL=1